MEGGDALSGDHGGYGRRLLGALVAGASLAAVLAAAVGFGLQISAPLGVPAEWAIRYRPFLAAGGWLWLPLWGASLASLRAAVWAPKTRASVATLALGLALSALPLVMRPTVARLAEAERPTTVRAKGKAILKWSYRSPQTVAQILPLSFDPDPRVREQAVLALGVNVIVTDIEHPTVTRPPRFADHPLRAGLRDRLLEVLRSDSVEAVRAEAARALWKSPITFGRQPSAAETLAAVLDRSIKPGAIERLAWLALDGAAGEPDSTLKAAAARFAEATPDTELARVARLAAGTAPR